MTIHFGEVPAGIVLYVPFASYDHAGASVTLTGLAVTDIEIYKDGSVTQRASDAGYTLLDTDGIDFDGITGINGFSIDTGDNTTAGFYAVGSQYMVVVSAVTISGSTVNFIAALFRIRAAEHTSGYPVVTIKDGTGTGELDTASGVVLAKDHAGANLATAAALDAVDNFVDTEIGAIITTLGAAGAGLTAITSKTDNLPSDPADASVISGRFDTLDTSVADLPTNAELATALGTADDAVLTAIDALPTNAELTTALGTADDAVLTQIALVKAQTDLIPSDPADASVIAGRFDTLDTSVADLPTNAELATALGTADNAILAILGTPVDTDIATDISNISAGSGLDAAGVRDAIGLATANLDTQLGDLPTNAELATSQAAADDATLTQIALVKTETDKIAAVKSQTDSLTFTVAGVVDANIQRVNDVVVTGTGAAGDEWGP